MSMVAVKLLRGFKTLNAGEIAGFPEDEAKRLVLAKAAVFLEPSKEEKKAQDAQDKKQKALKKKEDIKAQKAVISDLTKKLKSVSPEEKQDLEALLSEEQEKLNLLQEDL